MNQLLEVFLLAMTPIGELRAAIPIGLTVYHLNWFLAYIVSVIGNLAPVVFLLLFLEPVAAFFSKHSKIFQKLFNWFFVRTRRKANHRIEKYGYPALVLFVAIPLPLTGAWTGSLIAFLFNIPFKKAFALITAGVAIAGLIVVLFTRVGIVVEKYFGFPVFLTIVAGIAAVAFIRSLKIRKLKNV